MGLGETDTALVRTGWNDRDEDFQDLHVPLVDSSSRLDTVTLQHLPFPIIHYYRSKQRQSAAPVAVTVLAEALADRSERRRKLWSLLEHSEWDWPTDAT